MYKLTIILIYLFEQRYDVIELVNHESLMAQLKEDLLLEKELAIQEERKHYEQKIIRDRQLKEDEKKDDLVIISNIIDAIQNFIFTLNRILQFILLGDIYLYIYIF